MTQVFKRNKRLLVAAIATLLFLGGYTLFVDSSYFNPGKATYPTISEEQAAEIVAVPLLYARVAFFIMNIIYVYKGPVSAFVCRL